MTDASSCTDSVFEAEVIDSSVIDEGVFQRLLRRAGREARSEPWNGRQEGPRVNTLWVGLASVRNGRDIPVKHLKT